MPSLKAKEILQDIMCYPCTLQNLCEVSTKLKIGKAQFKNSKTQKGMD
jgi:hypothetical protein